MDSDMKLIWILTLLILIFGTFFIIRITVFKDEGISTTTANIAETNTLTNENSNILNVNTYTNNNLNITSEKSTNDSKKYSNKTSKYESDKNATKINKIAVAILSLIFSIIMLYILYNIFEKYNLKTGLVAYSVYSLIETFIRNGFNFKAIFFVLILGVIQTLIAYVVYTKSKSFFDFFWKLFFITLLIMIIFGLVAGFVVAFMSKNNGILRK